MSSRNSSLRTRHCQNLSTLQPREWRDYKLPTWTPKLKHTEKAAERAVRSHSVWTREVRRTLQALLLSRCSLIGTALSVVSQFVCYHHKSFQSIPCQFRPSSSQPTLLKVMHFGLTTISTQLITARHRKHSGTANIKLRTSLGRRYACRARVDHPQPS